MSIINFGKFKRSRIDTDYLDGDRCLQESNFKSKVAFGSFIVLLFVYLLVMLSFVAAVPGMVFKSFGV